MQLRRTARKIYGSRYGKWIVHILFWLFILWARYYIQQITFNPYKQYATGVVWSSLLSTLNIAIVFYLIVAFIYPHWLKKKKYLAGIACIIVLIVLYTFLDYLGERFLLQDARWRAIMQQSQPEYYTYLQRNVTNILLTRIASLGIIYQLFLGLALPLFIKVSLEYSREQVQRLELARQNLQLEFNFLKSQVNPHFLFNTLNNIYSLILHDKKEQSADTVARLSAFMRYSLHEANADKMSIEKEIQLMMDYIQLEKIRLNYTTVSCSFNADGTACQLPPLLLLPLLENAFKYCPDGKHAFIDISLHLSEGRLEFICRNSYDPDNIPLSPGGIGTSNFTRRLEQYYSGACTYAVTREAAIYSVNLSIVGL